MVLVTVNNTTDFSTPINKRGVLEPARIKVTRDEIPELVESNDEDSDSDDSEYADFLAMLQTPSKKEVVVAKAVVQPAKAVPVAVAKKEKKVVNKKPVKPPAITGGTSFAAMAPTTPKKKSEVSGQNASPKASSWGIYTEEKIESNDEDSDSDDSAYADFLAMVQAPSKKEVVSKKEEPVVVVQAKAVQPVKAVPVVVAEKEKKAVEKPTKTLTVALTPKEKDEVFERHATSFANLREDDLSSASSESSEESDWSSEDDDETAEDDSDYADFLAMLQAPMTKSESLGQDTVSFNENEDELSRVESIEVIPKPKATPRATPARAASMPAVKSVAAQPRPEPKYELPNMASVATLHFAKQELKKADEMDTVRSVVKDQEPTEPLPIDHFTKMGEAETEANARAAWELAESNMPIGVAYFTAKAEEDRIVREAEQKKLSEQEMSAAARHFSELAAEKEAKAAEARAGVAENMPAAIQHFTVADRAEKDKKRQSIAEMTENPPAMAAGQEYFTTKDRAEKEKKRQEIQAMIENPLPASVATEHFNKVHSVRKLEIEAMANEPAPLAVEYFTQKANVEKSKRDLMLQELNENPPEPSAATKHFAEQESKKAEGMEAARSQIRQTSEVESLPIDYFTKQGEAEMEAKAKEARELSESHMPIGIAYFTKKAAEDKIVSEASLRQLSEQESSVATRHFAKIAAEKEAKATEAQAEEDDVMPAAIQHFTVADRAKKEKKRQSIAAMKENPPAMAAGQEYFTMKDRAEKEKKRQEIQDMTENPLPASVATEHFNKVHSVRQLEIEAMMNEPAPPAIEYFTQKANEEKSKRDLMLKELNENPPEASLATQHFVAQEQKKAEEMEAQRVVLRRKARKGSSQRAQVDWQALTKQQAPQVPAY
eukprot:CAMPEP_0172308384 /NCGR_PEP_ID=MMETSP1058-20130122/8990_1 /TAXON_ID=83371 /ORGANISM="Detonula confervacea, Strain CCMP 353" /LENGTH=888 /DNA_ID=CAMNT_0013020779 /DNA_START=41 /DNA_END=2707 /DNA_ORIENTATION=+